MKIYYNKNLFRGKRGGLTESIFCAPFEEIQNFTEEKFENERFNKLIETGKNFLTFTNIEDCDYVIIPYKWDGRNIQNISIIEEAKKYGKKIIALHNDDYPPNSRINIDEGYLFTTTLEKTTQKSNEFSFPALCGDFFNNYGSKFIETKNEQLTIGFCGAITNPIRNHVLSVLSSIGYAKTNFIVRSGFWEPRLTKDEARIDFFNNMKQNCFIVCMRGAGNFSYRLYETMMMGRIPIILDTNQVLPFENILNYSEFSIRIPETQLNNSKNIIYDWIFTKSEIDLLNIQKKNRQIWIEYMSPEGWISNFVREIEYKNNI